MIPITQVRLAAGTEESVLAVMRSGHLAQGSVVADFEERFADLVGSRHAVAVSNGTIALVAAIQALGLGPGDEVITSPFTFVATLNAILASGATARFADIAELDFNLDASAAEAAINPKTSALLPVHLFGLCADLPAFSALSERRCLALVEDAAQAHGASVDSLRAGSVGTGCFSFYATKNLTTGEGGMVTTSDSALADRLRLIRNQGMRTRYEYEVAGNNYRLTDIQAAVGLPQLATYADLVKQRNENAARLTDGLAGIPGLLTPSVPTGREHVWHQYTVRVTADARIDRDDLSVRLAAAGVTTGIYYPRLVFDYDCYAEHPGIVVEDVSTARRVSAEVLSLPVHPGLTDQDIDTIITATRSAFES